MPTLHTVNKSPFEKTALRSCLDHALDGAAVLLIEDGVYAALAGAQSEALVSEALGRLQVYALGPDLQARGVPRDRLIGGIEVIDYAGFVELAAAHDRVQAWL